MRSLLIVSAGLVLTTGGAAEAQRTASRPGASYDVPGRTIRTPSAPNRQAQPPAHPATHPSTMHVPSAPASGQAGPVRTQRWGSKIGGRWWAGANAPGGWSGYRRPHTGWAVPPYWNAPRFYVGDWSSYGLARPLPGYNWVRYYDDAVLIDSRGSVFDSVDGVDWDRNGSSGYVDYADGLPQDDRVYAGRDDDVRPGAGYDAPGDRQGYDARPDPGYAADRRHQSWQRDLPPPPPPPPPPTASVGYDAGYAPGPAYDRPAGGTWVSPDGTTTVTTTSGGYYPGGATTVVVQSAPVVTTTTTTEYYDDVVTYPTKRTGRKRRAR